MSDLLEFYSTNSLSWDQLDYESDGMRNLHYGLIHVGLPTLVDVTKSILPTIKAGKEPKNFTLCQNGDVAFADASENTEEVAKAVEFINVGDSAVVSGLHTIHGRDIHGKTISGYKGYAFASPAFHNQIRRIAQGTKIYSISSRNFAECFIGIPSKNEQTKIAQFMAALDERIATQNKIISRLESLILGIIQHCQRDGVKNGSWQKLRLADVMTERDEINSNGYEVHSVSVTQGVVNQVEYLGRSFAAKDTSNYNIARLGNIIYTKSPTGQFPYGIIKRNFLITPAAISPLYGVFEPKTDAIGILLHYWFMSPINTTNYLHPLIQKGAKNTINITNSRFLEGSLSLPIKDKDAETIAKCLISIQKKLNIEVRLLNAHQAQKTYLLQKMFV